MAKPTGAQAQALEKKALAAATKSEGMRMLLERGYTVAETAAVFSAPYGFAYGVAVRANGGQPPAGAERRSAAKTAAPAKATKAAAKAPARKAPARTSKAKAKAKA